MSMFGKNIDMRRPGFRANEPFDALPMLPPPVELESIAILKACISSRAAVAELNMAVDLIPNATILINKIPILEARASSELENIVTTTDQLFQLPANEAAP